MNLWNKFTSFTTRVKLTIFDVINRYIYSFERINSLEEIIMEDSPEEFDI